MTSGIGYFIVYLNNHEQTLILTHVQVIRLEYEEKNCVYIIKFIK